MSVISISEEKTSRPIAGITKWKETYLLLGGFRKRIHFVDGSSLKVIRFLTNSTVYQIVHLQTKLKDLIQKFLVIGISRNNIQHPVFFFFRHSGKFSTSLYVVHKV